MCHLYIESATALSDYYERNGFHYRESEHIPFFALLSFSVSRANMICVVATIFSSLAFLSSSVSMANLSRLVFSIHLHKQPELFASDHLLQS